MYRFFSRRIYMFGKKADVKNYAEQDINTLMESMERIISGDFNYIDVSAFHDQKYGEKFNQVIRTLKHSNNNYVMRLNEAMTEIGDNSNVMSMLENVQSQKQSIEQMENSSRTLEVSIDNISKSMANIRDNTHTIYEVSQNGTDNMNASIKVVNESSEMIADINRQVEEFQEKIDKINEIVTIVKNIASQSNLLALNASIEAARAGAAGRGFAIVADQVRQMSTNTSSSAEDIVGYVSQLKTSITALAASMRETTQKLDEGNKKVESSLENMENLNSQISTINTAIDNVFNAIDTQSQITKDFANQVEDIARNYGSLSDTCKNTGSQVYRMGRYIDTCRSDMARRFSDLTELDWLRVFEIDHFILMWRVYNNVVEFEHLKVTQLNNPDGCKIGKWLASQTDKRITQSSQFKAVDKAHRELHRYATESWQAKEKGDSIGAMNYFTKTHDAYFVYQDALQSLQELMKTLGFTEKTEIVVYGK
jgi:methyl-accepting chemotaxis protein